MADQPHSVRSINWRESFPFTNLFRTFRVAIHPSKIGLALLGLLMLYIGGRVLDGVWPREHLAIQNEIQLYEMQWHLGEREWMVVPDWDGEGMWMQRDWAVPPGEPQVQRHRGIFITFFAYQVSQVDRVAQGVITFSPREVVLGIRNFIIVGPGWLITHHPVYFIVFAVWFLAIWSIMGGAISRIAAVHVARDEKISLRSAIRFAAGKFLSFLFAPLIPLVIILILGAAAALGGLLMYIPWIGPILVGVLFILALLLGVAMTLVVVGTVGGFNLMYPTIAVEGSDSFDAISRSFSYVYARPWKMLFYTAVAVVYGALAYLFVRFFIFLVLALTHFFVSWWLWGQPGQYWPVIWPPPQMFDLSYPVDYGALKWSEQVSAFLISFWVYLVIGLLGAFAISFYFSANSIIYYLLRREVDATELDDVYLEQTDEEFGETAPVTPSEPAPAAPAAAPAPPAEAKLPEAKAPEAPPSAEPESPSAAPEEPPKEEPPPPEQERPPGASGA